MHAVEIRNLSKQFRLSWRKQPFQALDDVSFNVQAGEVFGLLGPNGSGKSTTMKIMLGILRADQGSAHVFGVPSSSAHARSSLGYVPENPYFYKHLSGQETLQFYGKLSSLEDKELKKRIDEVLELVDLSAAKDRRVAGYSKGMLQRIGLAAALIHRPKLLLLDEPTAGVDPLGSRMIRDLIVHLKEQGITILLSSHLLEQVQEVCDRVAILAQGKLVRQGTMEELLAIDQQFQIVLEALDHEQKQALFEHLEHSGARILESGQPKTTLESLFIQVSKQFHEADEQKK